jgi:hypothetical protein
MIQVSYVSRLSQPMSSEQLLGLLMQCRVNNSAQGVTGMMLSGNGTFLQVIEGDEPVIDGLVEKIWADPRHAEKKLLHRREISRREYADWSMAFERVSDEAFWAVEGLKSFGVQDFTYEYLIGHQPLVSALMDHYREPHYDQLIGEINAKDKVIDHLKTALAQVRDRAQVTRLALESLTEAVRNDECGEELLGMCETTLASVRPSPR